MTPAEGARSTPSLSYALTSSVGMDFGRLTSGDKARELGSSKRRALRCDGVISEDQARRRVGAGFRGPKPAASKRTYHEYIYSSPRWLWSFADAGNRCRSAFAFLLLPVRGTGIKKSRTLGSDHFSLRARDARGALHEGKLRQSARAAARYCQSQAPRARSRGPAAKRAGAFEFARPQNPHLLRPIAAQLLPLPVAIDPVERLGIDLAPQLPTAIHCRIWCADCAERSPRVPSQIVCWRNNRERPDLHPAKPWTSCSEAPSPTSGGEGEQRACLSLKRPVRLDTQKGWCLCTRLERKPPRRNRWVRRGESAPPQ
jgi:hypothetical protein